MGALSDADYRPCPHCERELHKWSSAQHVRACPKRPEIAQRMRETLTRSDGSAVSLEEYAQRAAGTDLPGLGALRRVFGSWHAVCAYFGAGAQRVTQVCNDTFACPHCGRVCKPYTFDRHCATCPERPEIADALRAALTSAEDGCLASHDEYDVARAPDLPCATVLNRHYGGWANVAARYGLPLRPREATNSRRGAAIARGWAARRKALASGGGGSPENDPLLVGAKRVAWDYGEFDGLAVCSVRQLPGGGVAYTVR